MSVQRTSKPILVPADRIQAGDQIFVGGRGAWPVVTDIRTTRGRRPAGVDVPRLQFVTARGSVNVPVNKGVRAYRLIT